MSDGRIITFYSYKGGTGRSMALANVAWILASNGKKVLVLDWDLEAPGLHRYFAPFLRDRDLTASDGLIDFVIKFATAAAKPAEELSEEERRDERWFLPYANILRYATSIDWTFDQGGMIDFIPAGRQGPSYSTRVNSFNWQFFYDRLGGGVLLERAKDRMRAEYDYVLIDSRTGVSDTSGICTVQMPDDLVVCFTLNNQSIEGAAAVARSVHEQRTAAGKPVDIFPVATRVESGEKGKLETRKALARERFRGFPNHLGAEERERYWGEAQVSYVPYYAYEEILACFGDNFTDRFSVLAACEQITFYVTRHEVARLVPPSEEDRNRILLEYEGGAALDKLREQEQFAEKIWRRFSSDDQELMRQLLTRLVRVSREDEVGSGTLRWVTPEEIEEPATRMISPLVSAGLLVEDGDRIRISDPALLEAWSRLRSWIARDRDFLLWRHQLQSKIADWTEEGFSRRLLLRGARLEEASAWMRDYEERFNRIEGSYIRTSLGVKVLPLSWRWTIALMVLAPLLILLLQSFPPRISYSVESIEIPQNSWVFSQDRGVAVAFSEGGPAAVLRAGDAWDKRTPIAGQFRALQVSPKGNFLAALTEDGGLFIWPSRGPQWSGIGISSRNAQNVVLGFTPDEKWVYLLVDRKLVLFSVDQLVSGRSYSPHEIGEDVEAVLFSPKGSFAAVLDKSGDSRLFTLPPRLGKGERLVIGSGKKIRSDEFPDWGWSFSQDEKWLALASTLDVMLFSTATARQAGRASVGSIGGARRADDVKIIFSPDGEWLFGYGPFSGLLGWPIKMFPEGQREIFRYPTDILDFGTPGNWVVASGYSDLIFWQMGNSSRAREIDLDFRKVGVAEFSPKGDWIAAGGRQVYTWKTGSAPSYGRSSAFYSTGGVERFRWCKDDEHLFAVGPGEIFFGEAGKDLDRIFSSISSDVQDIVVTADRRKLVVFGTNRLSFVTRHVSIWSQNVMTLDWPALAEEAN